MDTSVSQVAKYITCPMKWALGHVYGIWEQQSAAAEEGDELHMHHELHYKKGLKYDESTQLGALAAKAAVYLPHRLLDEPIAEQKIDVTYGKHTYRNNRIDLIWEAPAGPFVADYKKAKDVRTAKRFGLTKQTLRGDLAACVYAYYTMKFYNYDYCNLLWLYHCVAEMEILPVSAVVDMDDVKSVLMYHNRYIDEMADIKENRTPLKDIPRIKGDDSCEKYSGCGYAGKYECTDVVLRVRKKSE